LDRQTLIIITSDHGESFGNHDLFGHGNSLYFETIHVPLIFYWPGRIPEGVKVPQVVSLRRIPTTIMELLFKDNDSHKFPGISLSHLWSKNQGDDATEPVLAELTSGRFKGGPPNYPTSQTGLKTLITEKWHYIFSDSGREELYAWPKDRDESENLANNSEFSVITRELKTKLHRQFNKKAF
jgi:arylsulfatase A-like enzyme